MPQATSLEACATPQQAASLSNDAAVIRGWKSSLSGRWLTIDAAVLGWWDLEPMAGIKIRENVPVFVVNVVNGHLDFVTGFITVFFHDKRVILVEDRLAEFAAVGFCDFNGPGFHDWTRL